MAGILALTISVASKAQEPEIIPNTGQTITPIAPRNADFEPLNPGLADAPLYTAGGAVTSVTSPSGATLLVLTSGYNVLNYMSGHNQGKQENADSNQYVFVYDISSNENPRRMQVIRVPNTYSGIVFDPNGTTFYVSGGVDDDVHIYDLKSGAWSERGGSPIKLGHTAGNGLEVKPCAAGIAVTKNGAMIVVTNYYNDSISVLTQVNGNWTHTGELDLRPGKENSALSGTPGGEYPSWVSIVGNTTAYVSSLRDREIDVVKLANLAVSTRIKVTGQPSKMTLNAAQTRLFAAEDQNDSVAVIDTGTNALLSEIPAGAPGALIPRAGAGFTGHNTNSVTLTPDGSRLYITNGNTNEIAVVNLLDMGKSGTVAGLIPTGWYPTSVSFSPNGKYVYVSNAKSVTGPNPGSCHGGVLRNLPAAVCNASNEYALQLLKAGLQSFPVPSSTELASLTERVARNNHYTRTLSASAQATFSAVRQKIKHVIFIIKENRTYDQILGDLPVGNGDPSLTEFGAGTTPNLHALARNFVDLDNFYDRSEVSMDGWPWTTSARAPDVVEKQVWPNYAGRGLSNDSEGTNRNVNVSYPTLAERRASNPLIPNDPDLLPGTTDTSAPDGPGDEVNTGYIWNQALRAGLSVRNYGFFIDLDRYNLSSPCVSPCIPEDPTPYKDHLQVAYASNEVLRPRTDVYFRGFDNSFPDFYRFREWQRDSTATGVPQLSLVRFMHDHTGDFSTAIDGVNTPELQEADNDYAVGLLVQHIANSSTYKNNTLIFVIEDDSQNGGDHVDSHRSIAFVVGPYVKQGAVVSTRYNTVDFVRTIEELLGLSPLNLNDAVATPMADIFDLTQTKWSFTAKPSSLLANTTLPIDRSLFSGPVLRPTHNAQYWAQVTKGMDFSVEDHFDFATYNRILWKGLMGDKPLPPSLLRPETTANDTRQQN